MRLMDTLGTLYAKDSDNGHGSEDNCHLNAYNLETKTEQSDYIPT